MSDTYNLVACEYCFQVSVFPKMPRLHPPKVGHFAQGGSFLWETCNNCKKLLKQEEDEYEKAQEEAMADANENAGQIKLMP